MNTIPVLDMSQFGRGTAHSDQAIADEVGRIFRNIGFVAITGHSVGVDLVEHCFGLAQQVFVEGMTLQQRQQYELPGEGRQRGFTSPDVEVSVGHKRPNRMQFWHVNDPRAPVGNLFPKEIAEFGPTTLALHAELKDFATVMLQALALHLGRKRDFFQNWIIEGENLLRVIHYPSLQGDEDVERSGSHTDIDLLTVMVPATVPGLQVMGRDNEWVDGTNPPGALVVNVGDMFALHTFNEFQSTVHRVVNPQQACGDRFSMPLFVHPSNAISLVGTGAFKMRRLREINLLAGLPDGQIDY